MPELEVLAGSQDASQVVALCLVLEAVGRPQGPMAIDVGGSEVVGGLRGRFWVVAAGRWLRPVVLDSNRVAVVVRRVDATASEGLGANLLISGTVSARVGIMSVEVVVPPGVPRASPLAEALEHDLVLMLLLRRDLRPTPTL